MYPSLDSECLYLKRNKPSRWELAERYKTEHGRVFTPYETNPAPGVAEIRSPTLEPDGEYSIVCREGRGSFRVDREGFCFSDDSSMRPIGHITDFDEQQPSEKELAEFSKNLRKQLREMIDG
jgi:hypothetical protein